MESSTLKCSISTLMWSGGTLFDCSNGLLVLVEMFVGLLKQPDMEDEWYPIVPGQGTWLEKPE